MDKVKIISIFMYKKFEGKVSKYKICSREGEEKKILSLVKELKIEKKLLF